MQAKAKPITPINVSNTVQVRKVIFSSTSYKPLNNQNPLSLKCDNTTDPAATAATMAQIWI